MHFNKVPLEAKESIREYADFQSPSKSQKCGLEFVLQLGDLIDGQNSGTYGQGLLMSSPQSKQALDRVKHEIKQCRCSTWYNVIGNHELMNFSRHDVGRKFIADGFTNKSHCVNAPDPSYYSFRIASTLTTSEQCGWRFIILNTLDIGIIGRDKSDVTYKLAAQILKNNNPNNVVDGDGSNWFKNLKGSAILFSEETICN